MSEPTRCPSCGAPLDPQEAAEGGCPNCLLELALGGTGDPADDAPPTVVSESPEPGRHDSAADISPGSVIGPYRVEGTLGEGGMGVVYKAVQEQPVRRQVALKVIKRGMDSRQVVARFEAERQALARMDHPSIARVFDAGAAPDGRPYFAMEYIDGEPITEYCDRSKLSTRDRLALFTRTCLGLQHAHQKGVLHRDIKPSNVLVTEIDGEPVPKIIDFGVAKAIEQPLTERSLFTEHGVLLGTPEYMSPEQAAVNPLDVDTRSDVYSLGVLLYEILTGALPFDSTELRRAAFDEILRRIREETPTRPSARLGELGAQASTLAGSRRSDPAALRRTLSGDLDVIVMKALEKERERRYGSAAELAGDIERHLRDEPITARPPSAAYQLGKLVRRNRLASAFVITVAALLIVATAWLSLLYRSSQQNLERALAAENDAEREAATANEVSEFLVRVFEVSDPNSGMGETVTARELLDQAAERIDSELGDQPEVQAALMNTIGNVYLSLGLYEESESFHRRAVELRSSLELTRSREGARGLTDLAHVLHEMGRHEEAEALALESLAYQEEAFGADSLEVSTTVEILGAICADTGREPEAFDYFSRNLEIRRRNPETKPLQLAYALNNLAGSHMRQGRTEEAAELFERSFLVREEAFGEEHPSVAKALANLAELYRRMGRLDEAAPLFERALALEQKTLGPDHADLGYTLNNYGLLLRYQDKHAESVALFERCLALREKALGPDHPLMPVTLDNLARGYHLAGKLDKAEPTFRRAAETANRILAPEAPSHGYIANNFGLMLSAKERWSEAAPQFLRALEVWSKSLGEDHPLIGLAYYNSVRPLFELGQVDQAIEHAEQSLRIREAKLGAEHRATADAREQLERVLEKAGRSG